MRLATIGGDGVLRDADGIVRGARRRARPSFIGQAPAVQPAPAEKTAVRVIAERLGVPAANFAYVNVPGDPTRQLYPGRILFWDSDPSVYAVSFRPNAEGQVFIFGIDGPAAGTWVEVPMGNLASARVASEPEAGLLWNLSPTPVPAFPAGMTPGSIYPVSLLTGAMNALTAGFPTEESLSDPKVLAEASPGMGPSAVASAGLAVDAIDAAGASYDSLRIGKNALGLLRHVGGELLQESVKIIDAAVAGDYIGATRLVRELERNYALWGLLLERAHLWTLLNDFSDATVGREMDALYLSLFQSRLEALKKSPEDRATVAQEAGVRPEDVDLAISEGEKIVLASQAADAVASKQLDTWLTAEKLEKRNLVLGAVMLPTLLENNRKSIEEIKGQVPGKIPTAFLGTLSPSLLLAVGGGNGKMSPEMKSFADGMKKYVSETFKSLRGKESAGQLRDIANVVKASGAVPQAVNLLMGNLVRIQKEAKNFNVEEIWAPGRAEELAKKLEEKASQTGLAPEKRSEYRDMIRFLRADAARIEPALLANLAVVRKRLSKLVIPEEGKTGKVAVEKAIDGILDLLFESKGGSPYYEALMSSGNAEILATGLLELQDAIGLPPVGFGALVEAVMFRSKPSDMSPSEWLGRLQDGVALYSNRKYNEYNRAGSLEAEPVVKWLSTVEADFSVISRMRSLGASPIKDLVKGSSDTRARAMVVIDPDLMLAAEKTLVAMRDGGLALDAVFEQYAKENAYTQEQLAIIKELIETGKTKTAQAEAKLEKAVEAREEAAEAARVPTPVLPPPPPPVSTARTDAQAGAIWIGMSLDQRRRLVDRVADAESGTFSRPSDEGLKLAWDAISPEARAVVLKYIDESYLLPVVPAPALVIGGVSREKAGEIWADMSVGDRIILLQEINEMAARPEGVPSIFKTDQDARQIWADVAYKDLIAKQLTLRALEAGAVVFTEEAVEATRDAETTVAVQGMAIASSKSVLAPPVTEAAMAAGKDPKLLFKIVSEVKTKSVVTGKKLVAWIGVLVVIGVIMRLARGGGDALPPAYAYYPRDPRPTDPPAPKEDEIPWDKILYTAGGVVAAIFIIRKLMGAR